jgi:transcriptional regulator with XRE-family HTH domain
MPKSRQAKNTDFPKYERLLQRIYFLLGTSKTTEIARILDVSASTVSDWKADRSRPTLFHLGAIAKYGDSTMDWLVNGRGRARLGVSVDGIDVGGLTLPERETIRELAEKVKADEGDILLMLMKSGLTAWGFVVDARETTREIIYPLLGKLGALDPELRKIVAVEIIHVLQARLDGRYPVWYSSRALKRNTKDWITDEVGEALQQEYERYRDSLESPQDLGPIDEFDIANAIEEFGDPEKILNAWYAHEGVTAPDGLQGLAFSGWADMTKQERIEEIRGARSILDHARSFHDAAEKTKDPS